jgi:hypothetical protein
MLSFPVVVVALALACGQIQAGSIRENRPLSVRTFDEIIVDGALSVFFTQLPAADLKDQNKKAIVEVEASQKDQSYIVVEIIKDHILSITIRGSVMFEDKANVYVQFFGPLQHISIDGAVKAFTEKDGIFNDDGKTLVLKKRGASEIDFKLNVPIFELSADGAGEVKLAGQVREKAVFGVHGAVTVDASTLESRYAVVHTEGASKLKVLAMDKIELEASGSSHISYELRAKGEPTKMKTDFPAKIERL